MTEKQRKVRLTIVVIIILLATAFDAWLIVKVPYALNDLQIWFKDRNAIVETEAETKKEIDTEKEKTRPVEEILKEEKEKLQEIQDSDKK